MNDEAKKINSPLGDAQNQLAGSDKTSISTDAVTERQAALDRLRRKMGLPVSSDPVTPSHTPATPVAPPPVSTTPPVHNAAPSAPVSTPTPPVHNTTPTAPVNTPTPTPNTFTTPPVPSTPAPPVSPAPVRAPTPVAPRPAPNMPQAPDMARSNPPIPPMKEPPTNLSTDAVTERQAALERMRQKMAGQQPTAPTPTPSAPPPSVAPRAPITPPPTTVPPIAPTAAPPARVGMQETRKHTMSPELFQRMTELIYKLVGIRFQEAKTYFLASKLGARADALGLGDLNAYYNYLLTPEAATHEHHNLMDAITINETFFFRNQPQIESFERDILPALFQKRRAQGVNRLRIWSCASSTGDEAYTTALQLLEMPAAQGFTFEIIGTDICREALEKARAGVYKKYAIRNITPDLMAKYFTTDATQSDYYLSDDVKKHVQFQECNLIDSARIRMLGKFDIIFCRNVLIYFDGASKEDALRNLYNAMQDDGYLMAGHSENIYSQRHIFRQIKEYGQAHAYEKAPPGTQPHKA